MECNKDEATRAKEIAEKKFVANDFEGAKKFALKAKNLYPGLEGLSQMLATFDVYICASSKTGEADWYSILGINPSADDETVKKQYKKLALTLHPDKNKSVGAEGAFQLISQASNMLSDKSNRALYDQRRSSRASHQKSAPPSKEQKSAPPSKEQTSAPSSKKRKVPAAANGFHDSAKSDISSGRVNGNSSQVNNPSASRTAQKANPDTFWTLCTKCKMQYEYLTLYCNQHLLCQTCLDPFLATEIPPPSSYDFKTATPWNSIHQKTNSNIKSATKTTAANATSGGSGDANSSATFRWTPLSQGGSSNFSHAATAAQKTYEEAVREFDKVLAADRQEKGVKRKYNASEKMSGPSSTGLSCKNQISLGTDGVSTTSASFRNKYSEADRPNRSEKTFGVMDLSQIEICKILIEKARAVICKKISADKSSIMPNDATPRDKAQEKKAHTKDEGMKKSETSVGRKNGILNNNVSSAAVATGPDKRTSNLLSVSVPDPEFYDFDKDRNENSFQANQVWAAYDDDGLPRFYAIIHAILSRKPFKLRISWLNSKTNAELGPLNWVGSGFLKTCGDFRVGKYEVNTSLNSFSHSVRWTKDTGVIRIFPRKGDVWALYRNWSPDWNEETPEVIIQKYDMVEVLEDCNGEMGVVVAPLVKVAGFKTVFRQQLEHKQTKRIPKAEMFRFSHQVPRHLLTSQEAPSSLVGCMELDPAAAPTDLIHFDKAANEDAGNSKEKKVVQVVEID